MSDVVQIGDATLYHGDCLEIIGELSGIDALITDPPYSSGGQFRGDRSQRTSVKYVNSDSGGMRDEFSGDNRDQRAFLAWMTMWMSRALYSAKDGATCCVFSDWRQVPTMSDAIQCGGWVWRNLVTWWKPGVRMQRGRFSASSEYILYGSHGLPAAGEKSPQNVLTFQPVGGDEKEHIAEKPVALLETLCGITPAGALVLDPFMGSGTTGVACANLDRRFIGVELDRMHFDRACERIDNAYRQGRLIA